MHLKKYMAKKRTKKRSERIPTEPMLIGLGLAAILRDQIYDVLAQGLKQTAWLGKSRSQIEKTLRARGGKEYVRIARDMERVLGASMKRVKKTTGKK